MTTAASWAGLLRGREVAHVLPVGLGAAAVIVQVAWPLTSGGARHVTTAVVVTLFFAASVAHAAAWRGAAFTAGLVAVTAGGGLLVEALGVRTGVPFGRYSYTDTLPPYVLGVPWVVPLAWTMMAYPALVVARRVTRSPVRGVLLAGGALAAWDLFLDPQMVLEGHWVWAGARLEPLGIPLTNFGGWLLVATMMAAVVWPLLPDGEAADDRLPVALYTWTWAGSTVAHAVFLGLPGSAAAGAAGMGAVVWLLARAVRRQGGWQTLRG